MRITFRIMLLIGFAFITGCQYDPFAGDLTTTQPKKNDVAGVYQFEMETISQNHWTDTIKRKAIIILNVDGSYEADAIPNVFKSAVENKPDYISAKGKWEIEVTGGVDNRRGEKPNWGIRLTSIDECLSTINFTGDAKPYGLIITYDDPDLGEMIKFKKIR